MNAVVTMAIGPEVMRAYGRYTLPYIKQYASKIGAAFHVIEQQSHPALHIWLAKFQLGSFLQKYERVAFIDLDAFVLARCPNIFDCVPASELGAMLDYRAGISDAAHTREERAVNAVFGPAYMASHYVQQYFSAWLLVLSQVHAPLFDIQLKQLLAWQEALQREGAHWYEQTLLNYFMQVRRLPVHFFQPDWCKSVLDVSQFNVDRFGCNIVHYGSPKAKSLIALDLATVHAQYAVARTKAATCEVCIAHREQFADLCNLMGLTGEAVEVGVLSGEYSSSFLARWRGKRLYSVDPWCYQPDWRDPVNQAEAYAVYEQNARTRLMLFGERSVIIKDTSVNAAAKIPAASLDFVYIDGRHDYAAVMVDLVAWWAKMRPGGIFAGHDYMQIDLPDRVIEVRKAVDDFFGSKGYAVRVTGEPRYKSWWVIV